MDPITSPPPLAAWSKACELGLPELDVEHETLLEIVAQLHAGMTRCTSALYLQAVRARLERYAAYHFQGEEELLATLDYPGLASQRREHAWFLRCVGALRLDAPDHGAAALAIAGAWLVRHIQENDGEFAGWLARTRPTEVVALRRTSAAASGG